MVQFLKRNLKRSESKNMHTKTNVCTTLVQPQIKLKMYAAKP